jgi:hypothetical protein
MQNAQTKRAQAQLDNQIEYIFKSLKAGPINIFAIGAIFRAGRAAHERGEDLTAAVTRATREAEAQVARRASWTVQSVRLLAGSVADFEHVCTPERCPADGWYYVTVRRDDGATVAICGPYRTHEAALAMVRPGREAAERYDPRAVWYAYGTSRMASDIGPGKLNAQVQS